MSFESWESEGVMSEKYSDQWHEEQGRPRSLGQIAARDGQDAEAFRQLIRLMETMGKSAAHDLVDIPETDLRSTGFARGQVSAYQHAADIMRTWY